MMTIKEQDELITSLPADLFEQYKFNRPLDYSKYKSISGDGYVYYPELDAIVVGNSVTVQWETDRNDICEIDLSNPEHLNELMRRAKQRINPKMVGIMREYKGQMTCIINWSDPNEHSKSDKTFKSIAIDDTYIYYLSDEFDLEHDERMRLLAKCLFIGRRYNPVQIVPYKDEEPRYWGGNCI